MHSLAVILEKPEAVALQPLELSPAGASDVLVEIAWSGISSGTEKLLFTGQMPDFPGMGYPLVPGYESIGRVVEAGPAAKSRIGEWVFVPGSNCYSGARGLFGGTASKVMLPSARALAIPESLGADGVLCALAATALHAINAGELPDLIIGHGVLGRLLARLTLALGGKAPTVWEVSNNRRFGAVGYNVISPENDTRTDYASIYDASGDAGLLDELIGRLSKGGEITLAGFYKSRLGFDFAPAFMREARFRVAAEWQPQDIAQTIALIQAGALNLGGLITDTSPASRATEAYPKAFSDPDCLKMVLDWSEAA
ncbi:2-desacetyl-2-hydroxyethyl bacteriochlorophyllide A dehydrogenase [Erythrobacter longus]|uniref:2-desacetyl-2-hydroxyethyl bacteriochlorophyllide A dehydrogenase n=1 Tax=Erythrobacter longus TaxID=1044 RepID=A0A074MBQ9_ERYLO|nr:chlorophyll synthesis pathway protein BchC [Erythrobacter longus]KEO90170.1 2-desacetyl-2-hydroxyethyl bacteriochlorophyllide A dehydrogenase [Erythrobacter longus]